MKYFFLLNLDHLILIMQFQSFDWLGGHEMSAIILYMLKK